MKCPSCKNYFFNKIATVYGNGRMRTFYKCKSCGFEDIQRYEDEYEVETLLKDYYKNVLNLSKFEKSFEKYHINDLDDFIRAFYEIKKSVDEKGSFDKLDESFWIKNSQVFDINLHDLKEATKELLQEIE